MEFSRQEYWSGLPFPSPGDLPNPGIETGSPALQADTLPTEPPGKPQLGTWKGGGGRGARRAPRATARTSTTTASPPAVAHGPQLCRPMTHGGPQCAGQPPPGGPRRRQTTTPTCPPKRNRALPHHLAHRYPRPPGPRPLPSTTGAPTSARVPGTLLPPPPRAEGRGFDGKRGAKRAGDTTEVRG